MVRATGRIYDPETMAVKDVEELLEELTALILPKLPGNRERKAVWATVAEAKRLISHAKFCLKEDELERLARAERPAMLANSTWKAHGEIYAASIIVRRVADEMGVSNFKLREVAGGTQS
jgi:hypothetical protein